jgi:DNA replication protein DnaC
MHLSVKILSKISFNLTNHVILYFYKGSLLNQYFLSNLNEQAWYTIKNDYLPFSGGAIE